MLGNDIFGSLEVENFQENKPIEFSSALTILEFVLR